MSRQALWPSAQAIQLLPTPVGPVISRFWWRSIQSPATRLGTDGAIEAARRAQVDVLDDGVLAQRGELEPRGEALVVALGGFAVDQQPEALLERQSVEVGLSSLLLEGLGHAGQAEGDQAFVGGMCRASRSPLGQW